jgi:acetaldehyde dehydrogenase/alcohol dehydrogenase
MAHKLGSAFHIPHGLANALLINEVIKYNSSDNPIKQTAFPQYKYPLAKSRYAKIADHLKLPGKNDEEKIENLINEIEKLKKDIGIPKSIEKAGVDKKDFYAKLDEMSENAFDDQCTSTNPRYPLISEIKDIYIKSFEGK